jgi:hypothetical protein
MYSAFATEGLGKDGKPPAPEELAPLAKTNIESLAEFDDFTYAKEAGAKVVFAEPIDYGLDVRDDKRVVLHFTLPLKTPASAKKAFSLQVYDPAYFVAFSFEPKDPVTLAEIIGSFFQRSFAWNELRRQTRRSDHYSLSVKQEFRRSKKAAGIETGHFTNANRRQREGRHHIGRERADL